MYTRFAAAGLLVACTWRAQPGGSPVGPVMVDYRRPTAQVLDNEGVVVSVPTAQWPAGTFAGAKRGDWLQFVTEDGIVNHIVREIHKAGVGDECLVELGAWA